MKLTGLNQKPNKRELQSQPESPPAEHRNRFEIPFEVFWKPRHQLKPALSGCAIPPFGRQLNYRPLLSKGFAAQFERNFEPPDTFNRLPAEPLAVVELEVIGRIGGGETKRPQR